LTRERGGSKKTRGGTCREIQRGLFLFRGVVERCYYNLSPDWTGKALLKVVVRQVGGPTSGLNGRFKLIDQKRWGLIRYVNKTYSANTNYLRKRFHV